MRNLNTNPCSIFDISSKLNKRQVQPKDNGYISAKFFKKNTMESLTMYVNFLDLHRHCIEEYPQNRKLITDPFKRGGSYLTAYA